MKAEKVSAGLRVLVGALVVFSTGCVSPQRVETLEQELSTTRHLLEESQAQVQALEEEQSAAGSPQELAAEISALETELKKHDAMNTELRLRTTELERLWSDSLAQSLSLSRQIYTLRKEKERLEQERDGLYAKIHRGESETLSSERSLSEVDVRIAELKGVCLYYPADCYAAKEAKREMNQLQEYRLSLLSPNPEARQPIAPFPAVGPTGPDQQQGPLDPMASFRALWADKLLPPMK